MYERELLINSHKECASNIAEAIQSERERCAKIVFDLYSYQEGCMNLMRQAILNPKTSSEILNPKDDE